MEHKIYKINTIPSNIVRRKLFFVPQLLPVHVHACYESFKK